MRKYHKAAVAAAMLGSVSFLGSGIGHAEGGGPQAKAEQLCSANESFWGGGLINVRNINLAVNVLGLQANDLSKHTSVNCTQVAPAGK
ncbi:hypothetical protein [Streptomyces sp. NPDC001843]|uniref:hypothetical protein n=1 Tax=Streptomyces sp. NPDC001843 TaxID=3364617 RepID=UPI0036B128B0